TMLREVQSAASFIASLAKDLSPKERETFNNSLCMSMSLHYKDHWFPDKPNKGNAYRCIEISPKLPDPVIESALRLSNFSTSSSMLFKCHVLIWVDPKEVSYKFGDEGSVGVHYRES
ncbi:hypothetical protein HELRODRAFT_126295, partial [Helobdella robusta]|uniref:Anti-proliferative protein domain-containing protein n=1 Tax=Helobdella robusta TaxID=6412 RepID=T1EH92_HELRO